MLNRLRSEIRYRLRTLFQRREVERELNAELELHLELETAKLMSQGISRDEAQRQAKASFGGVERFKDETREAHGVSFIDQTSQDVRYALRGLRTRWAFTLGVVTTLALGIGANATMFGIVDRLLFRAPQSLRDASTVHRLYRHSIDNNEARIDRNFSYPTYLDLKKSLKSFNEIAAFQTMRFAVGEGDAIRELPVTVASASYFSFFDAQPIAGRFFNESDDAKFEGENVIVLGYAYWQSAFGGRPVLGQQIRVGRGQYTIVGIAPQNFVGMSDQGVPAIYMPITTYAFSRQGANYTTRYGWSWLETIVRREPQLSIQAAQTDLSSGFAQSWRTMSVVNPGWGTPESAHVSGELAPVQLSRGPQAGRNAQVAKWIGGVAIIVLLIACANVANLLLSRAIARRREIAVRLALGVSRSRLARQLFTESLLLAGIGSIGGLAIAQWGATGLRRWFLPNDLEVGAFTDARTLLFAVGATLVVALLTGVAPAIRAGRADVASTLKANAIATGAQHAGLRAVLLVFQVALSVVLLIGAGLFVRSLDNANNYRLGYDAKNVIIGSMNLRGMKLGATELSQLAERLTAAAKTLPGVVSVSAAQSVPFMSNDQRGLIIPGVDSVDSRGRFLMQSVFSDYFSTIGTRIVRGRALNDGDRKGTMAAIVVSDGMAKALWGEQDPLGKCVRFKPDQPDQVTTCMTVVGVAEEIRLRSFVDPREHAYYIAAAQSSEQTDAELFVRVSGNVSNSIEPMRRRLQAEMPGTSYITVTSLAILVEPNLRSWHLGATMFVAFGTLALVLAAVGLYSLIAYDVAQRKRDLSVRIALGATLSRVMMWVVGRGVRLVLIGVAFGGAIAALVAPKLQSQMFQQSPRDPQVFGAVIAVLLLVGVIATVVPALRASQVDPIDALRNE